MGLFEDINAMMSNSRGKIDFERQMAELSKHGNHHTQSIRMVPTENQSGSTTSYEETNSDNDHGRKRRVVKKLVRRSEETSQRGSEITNDEQKSSETVISKVQQKTSVTQTSIPRANSHIKLPDISTIRDGVVWSEILGAPRCKKRYQRYKNR